MGTNQYGYAKAGMLMNFKGVYNSVDDIPNEVHANGNTVIVNNTVCVYYNNELISVETIIEDSNDDEEDEEE